MKGHELDALAASHAHSEAIAAQTAAHCAQAHRENLEFANRLEKLAVRIRKHSRARGVMDLPEHEFKATRALAVTVLRGLVLAGWV